MIDQLQNVFKSLIRYDDTVQGHLKDYRWFKLKEGPIIGIEKQELDEKTEETLSIFLEQYAPDAIHLTESERLWHSLIFQRQNADDIKTMQPLPEGPYEIVLFHLKETMEEKTEFEEAVKSLFPAPITLLWENNQNGLLIFSGTDMVEETSLFHDIVNTLISDFYTDVSFYIGKKFKNINLAHVQYEWGKKAFQSVRKSLPEHQVYYLYHAVPYLFLEEVPADLSKKLLDFLPDEEELIGTVKMYLESNMNLSLASKRLYMHRNTVQYRIDKFIEKTGIDVKDFHGAITAYLAILNVTKE